MNGHRVTVDMVVFRHGEAGAVEVLLIRRGKPPFEGHWALPGGYVEIGERTHLAALRELKEETGLELDAASLVGVFDSPQRDSRGPTIGIAYWAFLPAWQDSRVQGGDDAAEAQWMDVTMSGPLAFDHDTILSQALIHYEDRG